MKAIQYSRFGGPEVLEYVDLPTPSVGEGEVLIAATAIGVNFPDIRERLGVYNQAETRVGGVRLPHVGGLQVVGHVVDTGAEVDASLRGKKVMALVKSGAYAQLVAARTDNMVVLDPAADDLAMASLPTQGTTAYITLNVSARLRSGESVLIHGAAGGVGSIAIQIAKICGAGTVIGTASSQERRDFARGIGADHVIGYDDPKWPQAVLDLTGGRGVDVILESIGGAVFEQNFDCLATFGRHVILGSIRGPGEPLPPRRLMTNAQSMTGFYLPLFYQRPELISESLRFLAAGVQAGTIKANIATVLSLSQAAEAHRLLQERRARGVIVLDPKD